MLLMFSIYVFNVSEREEGVVAFKNPLWVGWKERKVLFNDTLSTSYCDYIA